jgi:predicted CXXCH cytochrome family protein
LAFSSTGTFNLNDIFYVYVRADLRVPQSTAMVGHTENGRMTCSSCHDQHLQVNQPFDPAISTTYTAGVTNNRHFQRVANNAGALCGDCHANRNVGKGGTSHPVHVSRAAAPNTKAPSASLVLSSAGNVECLTCHDVHGAAGTTSPAGMLLRVSNSLALCTDCHTLADTATANVHTNPTSGILWPGDQYGGSTYPAITNTADRGACKNCHTPHGWVDAANPTQSYGGGFGARQDNLCLTCHDGSPSLKDIRTEVLKAVRHPVARSTGGRLVGCGGCHNPHMAIPGVHAYATTATLDRNRIRTATGVNLIGSLKGADGVAFNYSGLANWGVPTAANFTKLPMGSPAVAASGAEFEYQVCFKCHTSHDPANSTPTSSVLRTVAWGGVTPYYTTGTAKFTNGSPAVAGTGTTWTAQMVGMYLQKDINSPAYRISAVGSATSLTLASAYTGATDAAAGAYAITRQETDLAQEFNPANRSGHPVVTGLNNYPGSAAPKALINTYMKAPWNTNLGTQTMLCSDCHSTDGSAAQGPHGSAAQFMLRSFPGGPPPANWPAVTLANTFGATVSAQSWCKNCHVLTNSSTTTNNVHTQNSTHMGKFCYNCHLVVPHGSKLSRLMASNTNMPTRYAYQNNLANVVIIQFKKTTPQGYAASNCQATAKHSQAVASPETW